MGLKFVALITCLLAVSYGNLIKELEDKIVLMKLEELLHEQKREVSTNQVHEEKAKDTSEDPLFLQHRLRKPNRILKQNTVNPHEQEDCKDESNLCQMAVKFAVRCDRNIMRRKCKKFCNLCKSTPNNVKREKPKGSDFTDSNFISQLEHPCFDVHKEEVCRYYASFHQYCTKQKDFMQRYCRRTCNLCEETSDDLPTCKDKRRQCMVFTKHKLFCNRHRDFFATHCPQSCNLCDLKMWLPYPKLPRSAVKKLFWRVGKWEKCEGNLQWRSVRCIHFDRLLELPVEPAYCKKVYGLSASPVRNCTSPA